MQMEVWIVLGIAAAVIALATLFRNPGEEETEEARDKKRSPAERVRADRAAADLDRFLEEARRRRVLAESQTTAPPRPRTSMTVASDASLRVAGARPDGSTALSAVAPRSDIRTRSRPRPDGLSSPSCGRGHPCPFCPARPAG